MASTVTVTGKAGPGITVTAQVFSDVASWTVDCNKAQIQINNSDGSIKFIDIGGKTTFTVTVSGSGNVLSYVVSIS